MTRFELNSAGVSDVGLKRAENEDSLLLLDAQQFWLVCDGMGGHENGALASKTVVEGFQALQFPADFDEAIEMAANRMHEVNRYLASLAADADGSHMGTTAVSLLIREQQFAIVWVGDSRAYIFRRGGLFQLSTDHTHVQDLVDEGVLSPEQAVDHPMGHVLTRALGVEETVRVDIVIDMLEPGDRVLLCSDGLTGPVSDDVIRQLLSDGTPADSVRSLIDAAHAGGAADNVTAIVVAVEGPVQ